MEGLVSVVGILGDVLSAMQYLAPVPTFYRIVKKKSTEEYDCLPYICTVLNSVLWAYYGFIKPEMFVASINAFGVLTEAIYVAIYLKYAPPKAKIDTAILVSILNVALPGAAILVTRMTLQGQLQIDAAGIICIAPMVVMFASPLAAVKTVVTTKSVEYMPFCLSFILFLAGGVWTFYAVLVRDYFLGVPNAIGFLFGMIQLIVYVIYRNAKPLEDDDLSAKLIEEGSIHESLDPPPKLVDEEEEKPRKWWKLLC